MNVTATPPLPTYAQLEPVGQCNLRCQMCSIQFRQDGPPYGPLAFMPFPLYQRLLDELTNLKELHLQGLGEPMMHPRFFEMVEMASRRGVRVSTNSNLHLVNERSVDRLITSGLAQLHVSLDGATPQTYEKIRGRGRFDRVMRNIRLVLEARERLGSAAPELRMVMVIMRMNLDELPQLVRLADQLQFREIFVQHLAHDFSEQTLPEVYKPMRDFVDEQTLYRESLDRVLTTFAAARAEADARGIHLRLPRPRPNKHAPGTPGHERCSWPWTGAYISYQGTAMPCCMVATPDRMNLGSAANQPFESVWNGSRYQEFRLQLASTHPPEICTTCAIYQGAF